MPPPPVLIVVCVNGTHGYPSDWDAVIAALDSQFRQRFPSDDDGLLFTLKSAASQGLSTHDGLVKMAERLAVEVVEWFEKTVVWELGKRGESWDVYFSIAGHSLGGLIARYAVKLLMDPTFPTSLPQTALKHPTIIHTFTPTSYLSISTPHLGCGRAVDKKTSWGRNMWASAIESVASSGLSLTLKELMLLDGCGKAAFDGSAVRDEIRDQDRKVPVLMEMAMRNGPFMKALEGFRCTLVSAVEGDLLVGFSSSAICSVNPFLDRTDRAVRDVTGSQDPVGEAYLRVHSISHFPPRSGDETRSREIEPDSSCGNGSLFSLGNLDALPPDLKTLVEAGYKDLGPSPIGTQHHLDEPFIHSHDTPLPTNHDTFPTTVTRVLSTTQATATEKQATQPPPMNWAVDSENDLLFPVPLMRELQTATVNWRRINLHPYMPTAYLRSAVHALMVGKTMPFVGETVKSVGRGCAGVCGGVLVWDFLEAVGGGGRV
ncbi:hypothetical protein HDU67_003714 [Dinochytrium kinnereticum]|nr:hypothetical protein HDU67_003714 [Dinochytrium kinnereticum]